MRWNLLLAAVASSWGVVSVIVAGVKLAPEALVFWRCLLAAISLPVILAALGRLGSLPLRRHRGRIIGLGVLLALHWVLFFETVKRASVAVAILIIYTAPIFVAILAPRLLGERRSRIGLVALAISLPGLALITFAKGVRVDLVAVALGLGAALTYAFLIIGVKTVNRRSSPFAIAFWQYVLVSALLAPFVVAGGRALPTAAELPYVLLLGTVLTGVMGAVYIWNLRHVSAQAAGLLAYLEPVSAALLAWAILGQKVGWEVAVGGAAILLGGALVVLYEEPEASREVPAFASEETAAV